MPEVGWSYGMLLEKDEVMALARQISAETSDEMNNFQAIIKKDFVDSAIKAALLMLLLIGIFFGVSRAAAKRITQPISELSDGVRDIASGNLDKKLDIHTGDEIVSIPAPRIGCDKRKVVCFFLCLFVSFNPRTP